MQSVENFGSIDPIKAIKLTYNEVFGYIQQTNAAWADNQFQKLRMLKGNPFLDGMLVDGNGGIIKNWSAYHCALSGQHCYPNLGEILDLINRRGGKIVYPLVPTRTTILFWLDVNTKRIEKLLKGELGDGNSVITYPVHPGFRQITGGVKMVRVPFGSYGGERVANKGIILGDIRFRFQNPVLAPQAYFNQTPLYPIRNVDSVDFIAATLTTARSAFDGRPVALRFIAGKPWWM